MSLSQAVLFAIILLFVDFIWIGGASKLHQQTVQLVQGSPLRVRVVPAILFYVLASFVFMTFLGSQPQQPNYLYKAMILGLFAYGTFDLTNLAIFKRYPVSYAMADMVWGTFAVTLSAYLWKKLVVG